MLSNIKIHVYDFFKIFIILYSKKSQMNPQLFLLLFLFSSKVEKPYIPEFIYKHFPDPNFTFHNTKKKQSPSRNTTFFKSIHNTHTYDSAVHDYLKKVVKLKTLVLFCFFFVIKTYFFY